MTTTRSQRAIAALAALVRETQIEADIPTWDEPGIAAEARRHSQVPLVALAIAFLRAATDRRNTTPAALSQDGNRAWDDLHAWRCHKHPDQRARRTDGECASCLAERREDHTPAQFNRRPAPDGARELAHAARATPGDATPSDPAPSREATP